MKKIGLVVLFGLAAAWLFAAGVLVNRENSAFQIAHLDRCSYDVGINNQVAEVKVLNTFRNMTNGMIYPRFYFPLPRGASATTLRWHSNNQWHTAYIAGLPQNPQGGPSTFPDNFVIYIQLMPVVFDIPDSLAAQDSLSVELTYVQMLNYNFGSVTLNLKNNYSGMQAQPLALQSLDIDITSDKQILGFEILDINDQSSHTTHSATGHYSVQNSPANTSYRCVLQLSTDQLSSWGLSTYLDDAPDDGECGFFLYTMEEDSIPADSTFAMRLNIVIDVSGSMSWEDRLVNAKAAAIWVINHLQPDDMFNIILFDHVVRPLWGVLRINNFTNRSIAIAYIEDYVMPGMNGTNLYGGLSHALSQFVPPPPGVKNCILLLSDGQPTFGVTDTYQILHNINATVAQYHTAPNIFCFGIGSEVNYQLLNALALYHSGISIFLESSEIVNTTTSFYTEMRNPITMYPEVTVTPGVAVIDVLPDPFPTIYGGMQYRLVGRYAVPGPITINLLGIHQGTPVSYFYNYDLNATEIPNLGFVPKVWASTKIDKMLIEYYSYPPQSPQAVALRQEIIDLSIAFGVVCVFTSFNPDPPVANDDATEELVPIPIKLLQNYPNPFNPSTTISFEVLADLQEEAELRIYNLKGQVVYVARIAVIGKGSYEFVWHGTDMQNKAVSSGVYIYSIRCGKYILHSRMTLCK